MSTADRDDGAPIGMGYGPTRHRAGLLPGRAVADWWPSALMAAYGAGWCFTIPLGGNLFVAEFIAAACLPFVGWSRTFARYPYLRLALLGYGLILLGLVVADLTNQTPLRDLVRGWANPVFAVISIIFVVSVLRRDVHAFLYFLLATVLFKLVFGDAGYELQHGYIELSLSAVSNSNLFKIRIVPFLLPALMLAAYYVYRFGVAWSGLLYLATALLLVVLDARSTALALLAAAAFLLLRQFGFRITAKSVAILAVPALIGGQFLYMSYVDHTLASNPSGHTAVQLNRLENPYNPLELLAQGRSDWSIADVVIGEEPFVGHGSWARDADGEYSALLEERTGDYTGLYTYRGPDTLLFTHSFLLSSWVWGGIIGFAGALCVFWVVLRTALAALHKPGNFVAVSTLVAVLLFWDLFFSPIQVMRTVFPHFIGLLIVLAGAGDAARRPGGQNSDASTESH